MDCVWKSVREGTTGKNIHDQCGRSVESVIKNGLLRRTLDNVTTVLIGFTAFKRHLFPQRSGSEKRTVTTQGTTSQQSEQQMRKPSESSLINSSRGGLLSSAPK